MCERLVREAVVNSGGCVEVDGDGEEWFVIPRQRPRPSALEQCWEPRPAADSKFTEEEMAKITALVGRDLSKAIEKFAPGWKVTKCGHDMDPGLRAELRGRKNVLVTHPLSEDIPEILTGQISQGLLCDSALP